LLEEYVAVEKETEREKGRGERDAERKCRRVRKNTSDEKILATIERGATALL